MRTFITADNQNLTKYGFLYLIGKKKLTDKIATDVVNKQQLINALLIDSDSIVVLDYRLFDFGSISEVLSVKARFPNSGWVFVSEEYSYSFVNQIAVNFTSVSMIFKDENQTVLNDALSAALKGSRFISERVSQVLESFPSRLENEENKLTQTEIEIVKLIAGGLTTKEIAGVRFLSVHTVMTHRKNIFRKLEVNNIQEMTKYAVRAGWVDLSDYYI